MKIFSQCLLRWCWPVICISTVQVGFSSEKKREFSPKFEFHVDEHGVEKEQQRRSEEACRDKKEQAERDRLREEDRRFAADKQRRDEHERKRLEENAQAIREHVERTKRPKYIRKKL